MSQNIPVSNLPYLDVTGLQVSWASNTTLTITTGQARDANNVIDMPVTSTITVNAANTGANGLDTGSLANSTWYYVYIIGSSTNAKPVASLLSTSATPALPYGYDSYRRIDWQLTDGSAHFLKKYVYGDRNLRKHYWDAVATELTSGAATSFTDVDLTSSVPPSSNLAILNWKIVPATAGNIAKLRVNGSTSTTTIQLTGPVAAQPAVGVLTINTDSTQIIEYLVANASDALTLFCAGFEDFI